MIIFASKSDAGMNNQKFELSYQNIMRIIKPIFNVSVLLILLIIAGGCKSGKKNIKQEYSSKTETIQIDKNKIKGNSRQKALVEEALTWIGVPYAYGKSDKSEGTDCSGMVLRVYLDVLDIKLPRNSAKQAEFCEEIKRKDIQPGDLAFFATGSDSDRISHVGIMIDDTNFVHASTKMGVVISSLDTPYYVRTFKKLGRVKY